MKKNISIVFLGDLTADVYKNQGIVKLGGAALNSAVWAKRLCAEVGILSAVGNDEIGSQFIAKILDEGINTTFIEKLPGDTSSIDIFIQKNGERVYGAWRPGVLSQYHIKKPLRRKIKRFTALCVTIYPQYFHILSELRMVKPKANMRGKPFVAVNFGDMNEFHSDITMVRGSMIGADMLVFGLDKDRDERMINDLKDIVPKEKLLLITLGIYGSVAWYRGVRCVQPANEINVKDTTGAGDSFLSAFLVSYLETKDIQASLMAGTRLASTVIQKVGAY